MSAFSMTAADILDYLMEPIFTVPLIGDIPDSFFVAALYLITKRVDYLQPLI
jgi:predicted transcriptional regulator